MNHRTTRDLPMNYFGAAIVIPAGTRVKPIKSGTGETHYAVASAQLLVDLTGNTHDPKYRYAYVPADAVEASE